jgi:hypothetical protein
VVPIQKQLLITIFGLLLVFILLVSTTFTLDFYFHSHTVTWLPVCRVLLLAAALSYLSTVRASLVDLLDRPAVVIMIIIAVGAISGLFGSSNWFAYLRHGFQYAFMLAFYLVGRDLAQYGISERQIQIVSVTTLIGYAVATVFYALTPGIHSGSYSYQPNLALLPLAYNHDPLTSFVTGVLILVGNKRAVFLGACFCIAAVAVLAIERRHGKLRLPVQAAAIFGLAPVIAVLVTWTLTVVHIPLVGMVADRFSSAPSFNGESQANATRQQDFRQPGGSSQNQDQSQNRNQNQYQSQYPNQSRDRADVVARNELQRNEARLDPLVRLTGARNVEVMAVWDKMISAPVGILFGAGFGSEFQVSYISPNDYSAVSFWRDQADLMPVHIALTSGFLLAVLFPAALFWDFWRMFLRLGRLERIDGVMVIFCLGLTLDLLLGFTGTNPVVWLAIGYATKRTLDRKVVPR